MLTPEIIGRIFGIRRQPPPWSLPGVGEESDRSTNKSQAVPSGGRSPSLAPSSRATQGEIARSYGVSRWTISRLTM
jgi:hypothetical protein